MRNDSRGGQRRNNSRNEKPDPLLKVEWCRVIEHPEAGGVIVVVTEPALHVIRLRPKPNSGLQAVGSRIFMGIDHSKREVVQDILGFARIRDLSEALVASDQSWCALSILQAMTATGLQMAMRPSKRP